MAKKTQYLVEQRYETTYEEIESLYDHFFASNPAEAALSMVKKHSRMDLGATIVYAAVDTFRPTIEMKVVPR